MDAASSTQKKTRVSVIIPSWDGERGGAVASLLQSIGVQSFTEYEVCLVHGVAPQGRAINEGARQARGEILVILDDDSRLADKMVFSRLVGALDEFLSVGMVGASVVPPPEANPFQRRMASQFPRFNMPVVEELTDSDFPCHGCCAIRAEVFKKVGGEREDLIRGLDPDLRQRIREAGHRVALAPGARVYHPVPAGWRDLVRTFFRNGYGSAYTRKFHADAVYETSEELSLAGFRPRRAFLWRLLRYLGRLLAALCRRQFQRLTAYVAYAAGYLWGLVAAGEESVSHGPRA